VILCLQFVCVDLSEYIVVQRERRKSEMSIYFANSGRRGRKKIMEKENENFVRKGEVGKKNEDDCARIFTRDNRPDFV